MEEIEFLDGFELELQCLERKVVMTRRALIRRGEYDASDRLSEVENHLVRLHNRLRERHRVVTQQTRTVTQRIRDAVYGRLSPEPTV